MKFVAGPNTKCLASHGRGKRMLTTCVLVLAKDVLYGGTPNMSHIKNHGQLHMVRVVAHKCRAHIPRRRRHWVYTIQSHAQACSVSEHFMYAQRRVPFLTGAISRSAWRYICRSSLGMLCLAGIMWVMFVMHANDWMEFGFAMTKMSGCTQLHFAYSFMKLCRRPLLTDDFAATMDVLRVGWSWRASVQFTKRNCQAIL